MSLSQQIKDRAHDLGFDLTGVAPVQPVPELSFYKDWIEAGYAGEMAYLKDNIARRTDITAVVPEAKSVIVCALVYETDHPLSTEMKDRSKGWIARYAWGDDYHEVLEKKLFALMKFIKDRSVDKFIGRLYVDTGPLVDRVYAKYAGIGWFGKNTCIINQQKGSWFFLGEIITNLELEYDTPVPDRCGTCNRCIDACPTDAILEPYVLDSRRCISYLTIELRAEIPLGLRHQLGNHIFGCDICQDVCPWNRKAARSEEPAFQPRDGLFNPSLGEMAGLNLANFRKKFSNSPIKRSKHKGFLRNVAVAMGNSADSTFLPALNELTESPEPLVAEHAQWAIDMIENKDVVKKDRKEVCKKSKVK